MADEFRCLPAYFVKKFVITTDSQLFLRVKLWRGFFQRIGKIFVRLNREGAAKHLISRVELASENFSPQDSWKNPRQS